MKGRRPPSREHLQGLDSGLVVRGHGRHYLVQVDGGQRVQCVPRGKKSDAVVGDRVRWLPTSPGEGVIEAIEARRNLLSCASCHESDATQVCTPCHRVGGVAPNPHPPGFRAGIEPRQHSVCTVCHGVSP